MSLQSQDLLHSIIPTEQFAIRSSDKGPHVNEFESAVNICYLQITAACQIGSESVTYLQFQASMHTICRQFSCLKSSSYNIRAIDKTQWPLETLDRPIIRTIAMLNFQINQY